MKIELGKCYKTRDGRKARVICVDRDAPKPIIALVRLFFKNGTVEMIEEYTVDGTFDFYNETRNQEKDLVEEWRDPPPEPAMSKNEAEQFIAGQVERSFEKLMKAAENGPGGAGASNYVPVWSDPPAEPSKEELISLLRNPPSVKKLYAFESAGMFMWHSNPDMHSPFYSRAPEYDLEFK